MKARIIYHVGIDEVGRGPLAGPLCIGACLIRGRRCARVFKGVKDCKQLSLQQRLQWLSKINEASAAGTMRFVTAFVGESTIDRDGLSAALRLAVCRALKKLGIEPEECKVLLDGALYAPKAYPFQETIINGDEQEPLIALASIVAKVRRDRRMERLARQYPLYGFEKHKGYGTKQHYSALRKYGISPIHRRSFLKNFENSRV